MKLPTYASVRTTILLIVGVGMAVYNAVLGDHNFPTFIVALMFCGFPFVINLDEVIHKTPISMITPTPSPTPSPTPDPAKESAP